MAENSNESRSLNILMMLTIMVGTVVAPLMMYKTDAGFVTTDYGPRSDLSYWQDDLESLKPEVVFTGNSMLRCSLDEELFHQMTGHKSAKFTRDGSASCVWYLFIKNVILGSEFKPNKIVLFFRDNMLTYPEFRTTDQYETQVRSFSDPNEPVLDTVLHHGGIAGMRRALLERFPLILERQMIRDWVDDSIRTVAMDQFTLYNGSYKDISLADVFDAENMDSDLLNRAQLEAEASIGMAALDFKRQLRKSFLPHMIKLTKENNVELVLVRVRRRRIAEGGEDSKQLQGYMRDLRRYLKKNGINLFDYTDRDELDISLYDIGDHLSDTAGQETFTRLLANDFRRMYPSSASDRQSEREPIPDGSQDSNTTYLWPDEATETHNSPPGQSDSLITLPHTEVAPEEPRD